MASEINVAEKYGRSDCFTVSPFDVIVREELRGRRIAPTDEQIIEMAVSLKRYGLRQPVECRKLPDNRLLLVSGFTRTAAARLLREGFTDADGEHHQEPEFQLKAMLSKCNDREAYIRCVVENAHRNATSPIDDAYNQERLRDQHGLTNAEIAKLYRYSSPGKVLQLETMLTLAPAIQDLVHTGELAMASALEVATLPEPDQVKVVEKIAANGRRVTAPKAREAVREHILRDTADAPAPTGPDALTPPTAKPRSMRELRSWLATDPADAPQRTFAAVLLAWLAGTATDAALTQALDALAGGKGR